jgi:thioredoxin 1
LNKSLILGVIKKRSKLTRFFTFSTLPKMAYEVTDDNFQSSILESSQVALLDFWAPWCGPCRAIAPIIEELSSEYAGRAVVGKVDVDSNPDTAMKYNVRSIPTILIIKNGQVVDKHVGATSKAVLKAKLDAHI